MKQRPTIPCLGVSRRSRSCSLSGHCKARLMNLLRWIVWIGCIAGLLICSIWLGDIFGIEHMSMECIMLFVVFAIATEPILRYGIPFIERVNGCCQNFKAKKKRW